MVFDLNGEYTHNVDSKGRIALPAKFRKSLPTDLVVTYDLKKECLYVFDEEGHRDWVASFFEMDGGFDQRSETHLKFRRALKRLAFDVAQDSAGRISIPADMRKTVGIDKEVVLIGNTGYFEIWDKKRLEAEGENDIDLSSFLRD
ncbi:MAG: division/cell wall cluster transcriptional repressor MraZ [Eggerthellaceae bacterium]|nr:division/cell wall cluster transcriptional repressor MraZ [Eggerthellaceae bacterium]